MADLTNRWVQDGTNAWKSDLPGGRVARVKVKNGSYVCRMTGNVDPGTGACGSYPTLDAAKARFEPDWTEAKDADLQRIPDSARKPGEPVDVDKVYQDRLAENAAAQ